MDKSMFKGIAVGGLAMVVLGASGVTGYKALTQPKVADVVAVKEVTQTVTKPRQVCETVAVQRAAPVKDENRIAGTVVGGLAGGLLGSAVGNGTGKTVATLAGAAAGGYAGNQVQKNMQEKNTVSRTERRCKTVYESHTKTIGYDVRYRFQDREYSTRLPYDPGNWVTLNVRFSVAEDAHPGRWHSGRNKWRD
jgi:uncharacterized protein YcfJ